MTGSLSIRSLPVTWPVVVARLPATTALIFGALLTGLLAADQGGYWPTAWGWTTLALAWVTVLALILTDEQPGRFELAWIAGFTAATGWTAITWIWTSSQTQTALEVERTLTYVAVALAATAVVKRTCVEALLWGVWLGTAVVSLYALLTRLLPDRLAVTDVVAGYRLSTPVGYWNGLGLVAAIATILGFGLFVHGSWVLGRVTAGASVSMLVPTLYFTFSRGAWISLSAALTFVVLVSPSRLRLVTALLVTSLPAGAALAVAYEAKSLRQTGVPAVQALRASHQLAWRLAAILLVAVLVSLAYWWLAERVVVPNRIRIAYASVLATAVLAGGVTVITHYGGPRALVSHARSSLAGGSGIKGNDLSTHLLTLSSPARLDQWHVAVAEWRHHFVGGTGAGTYAQYWMAARSDREKVLDVHNLYLETLAELGLVGLIVLGGALSLPLAAAARVRRDPAAVIAAGAYVAWLVHAAYDWDWELPGVTVAALLCGSAVLIAARGQSLGSERSASRWIIVSLVCAVGLLGTLGLVGNRALAQSGDDSRSGRLAAAASQAERAHRWAPWSSQPLEQLAAIRIAQGNNSRAQRDYLKAVAKDPNSWELWLALAGNSTGLQRAHAIAELRRLSPATAEAFAPRTQ